MKPVRYASPGTERNVSADVSVATIDAMTAPHGHRVAAEEVVLRVLLAPSEPGAEDVDARRGRRAITTSVGSPSRRRLPCGADDHTAPASLRLRPWRRPWNATGSSRSSRTFCEAHPVDEKILLVPSFPVGTQILDALARSGCAHLNLRPATVFSSRTGWRDRPSRPTGARLLSRAQLLARRRGRLRRGARRPTRTSGRSASVGPPPRAPSHAGRAAARRRHARRAPRRRVRGPAQGARARGPRARLRDARSRRSGAADAAEVFAAARPAARDGGGLPRRSASSWPAGLELSPLEERSSTRCCRASPSPSPRTCPTSRATRGAHRSRRALSEENEVRAVFRRIVDEGLPLDDVEIAFDDDARVPAARPRARVAVRASPARSPTASPSRTRARRRASSTSSTGSRATSGARPRAPPRATGGRTWRPRTRAARSSGPVRAARALRRARIVAGASATRRASSLERARRAPRPGRGASSAEAARASASCRRRRGRGLGGHASSRSLPCPTPRAASPRLPRARGSCASRPLLDVASDSTAWRARVSPASSRARGAARARAPAAEAAARLREAVGALAVASATPLPGHAPRRARRVGRMERPRPHVRPRPRRGAISGRRRAQDPVLLDSEREALNLRLGSNSLPLRRGTAAEESRIALSSLLARARGRVVLSFSNRDILQDAERFPSSAVLELFRALEGRPRASFVRRSSPRRLRPPRSCRRARRSTRSSGGSRPLPPRRRIRSARRARSRRAYPWLADGREARRGARGRLAFTTWDGRLSVAPGELDPRVTREPTSASRLEKLAKCPRAYFLQVRSRPLGAGRGPAPRTCGWTRSSSAGSSTRPPSSSSRNARSRTRRSTSSGKRPACSRSPTAISSRMRGEIPPPNDVAFRQQRDELPRGPRHFPQGGGEERGGVGSAVLRGAARPFVRHRGKDLASAEPVEIAGGGGTFLLQGQIDRIDSEGDGRVGRVGLQVRQRDGSSRTPCR